jgi:hypothetical protein
VALCSAYFGKTSVGEHPAIPDAPAAATRPLTSSVNNAPSIGGEAGTYARVGASYVFQPAAADADGDELTFSAVNLPPWAKLDPKSGRVAGTPAAADVGEYESIVINVADAGHVTSTAVFAITVLPPVTGVASLEWEVPASRLDGTLLDDLAGFRILYGRNPDDLDQSVFIEGTANTYEFSGLEGGIWYFAVAAVSANGLEGPPSAASMKSI